MEGIPGSPPDLRNMPSGCPFHPRCGYAFDRCRSDPPPPLLDLDADTRAAACWLQDGRQAVPAELARTAVDAVAADSADGRPGMTIIPMDRTRTANGASGGTPVLEARGLTKHFPVHGGARAGPWCTRWRT